LHIELEIMNARVKKYEAENTMMKRDVDSACIALQEAGLEKNEAIQDMVEKERKVAKNLKQQLQTIDTKEEEMKTRCVDLEEQLTRLRDELRASEERNSWYEEGQGLSDAVRHQKRLEADIRRREFDAKRLVLDMGKKNDQILLLVKACEVLRDKAQDDLPVDEDELKQIMRIEENGLRSQNQELLQQVETLEEDRNLLLKRLRDNAAIIGEDGVRFLGLSSSKMLQVIEFASNLKEDKVRLPMDHRSIELSAELSSLKVIRQSDLITIERLEREIEVLKTMKGDESNMESELSVLRTVLEDIQEQNKYLREQGEILTNAKVESSHHEQIERIQISPYLRNKLEEIVGECVEVTPSPSQLSCFIREYEKLEADLRSVKETNRRIFDEAEKRFGDDRRSLEEELFRSEQDSRCYKQQVSQLEAELSLRNDTSTALKEDIESVRTIRSSKRSVHVQVDIDRGDMKKKEVELQLTREVLLTTEHKLSTYENKVRRLQHTLNQQAPIHNDKKRILMAHAAVKELQSFLEEKNKLIAKYRAKDIAHKAAVSDSCTSSIKWEEPRNSNDNGILNSSEDLAESSTVSSLVRKLADASSLVKEKDSNMHRMKADLQNAEARIRASDAKQVQSWEALQILREMTHRLMSDRDLNEHSWEDERGNYGSQIEDLNNQLNLKEDRLSHLTKSLTRLKEVLRVKNEETSKAAEMESDLRRVKSTLSVTRRSKDHSAKALLMSRNKNADALEDSERLQCEVSSLRKQMAELRDEKCALLKRCRLAIVKIQELKGSSSVVHDESKYADVEDDYKRRILGLKKDNSKLRGLVASYKLKEGLNQMSQVTNDLMRNNVSSIKDASVDKIPRRGQGRSTKKGDIKDSTRANCFTSTSVKDSVPKAKHDDEAHEQKTLELRTEVDELKVARKQGGTIDAYEKKISELQSRNDVLLVQISSLKVVHVPASSSTKEVIQLHR